MWKAERRTCCKLNDLERVTEGEACTVKNVVTRVSLSMSNTMAREERRESTRGVAESLIIMLSRSLWISGG